MTDASCPKCLKEDSLCICDGIAPVKTKLHVLILQHPQEPDKELGSARIARLALENSTLRIGLSWPNLAKALGRPAAHGNWGVLYLGGRREKSKMGPAAAPRLGVVTKTGKVLEFNGAEIEGIVALDGTWAQAKTMWWRNAWLLKLRRLTLNPLRPSLYGRLRRSRAASAFRPSNRSPKRLRRWARMPRRAMPCAPILRGCLRKYSARGGAL